MTEQKKGRKKWYEWIPHPVLMLFGIIVLTALLSYILPAGTFDRIEVDGRQRVVPNSYQQIEQTPVGLLDMFLAIPLGFKAAIEIVFVVLASGIMFGILEKSGMVENTVGTLVKRMGLKRRFLLVAALTYIYGGLGVMIGYENNIAMVPIAAVISLAIGGDLILAAGMSVGAITVGFGLSPINAYTVGVGHKIAEMPLFSGAELRSVLCFIALSILAGYNIRYFKRLLTDESSSLGADLDTRGFKLSKPLEDYVVYRKDWMVLSVFIIGLAVTLYGVFVHHWYINEISAMFLIITVAAGIVSREKASDLSETVLSSVAVVAPGAFMVGFANAIRVVMEMGNIGDTIANSLAMGLSGMPTYASAICMSMAQSVINLFIPSGSGQALATLPIMIPVGELLGLTRQTTILAFQVGDGVTNLVNPTLGGLVAMISLCRVPFDRWLRYIFPLTGWILLVAWIFLVISVAIAYGPV